MLHPPKLLVLGLLSLTLFVFFVQGCGQYGKVNELTYEHAKALYSICNRRDSEALEVCAGMIAAAAARGQLSSNETSYLNGIIAAARKGDWEDSLAMSRQLMTDQVEH